MVMYYAHRCGWKSQRTVATYCGIDETGLSRFLDGRQDLGAVATYALFRTVRIPTAELPIAFELLTQAQAEVKTSHREAVRVTAPMAAAGSSAGETPSPAAAPSP